MSETPKKYVIDVFSENPELVEVPFDETDEEMSELPPSNYEREFEEVGAILLDSPRGSVTAHILFEEMTGNYTVESPGYMGVVGCGKTIKKAITNFNQLVEIACELDSDG